MSCEMAKQSTLCQVKAVSFGPRALLSATERYVHMHRNIRGSVRRLADAGWWVVSWRDTC